MARFTILFFFLSFTASAQTYLGYSKEEIYIKSQEDFKNLVIAFESINEISSVIKIKSDYETIHYYLTNDVCVKFIVTKPYSCNCLSADLMNYNSNLKSIGKMKWVNKDLTKIYQLKMNKKEYNIIITKNEDGGKLLSSSK